MKPSFRDFVEARRSHLSPNISISKRNDILEPELEALPDPEGAPVSLDGSDPGNFIRWLINKLDILKHDPEYSLWAKAKYKEFLPLSNHQNQGISVQMGGMTNLKEVNQEANEKLLYKIDQFLSRAKQYDRQDPMFQMLRSNTSANLTFWISNLMKSKYPDLTEKLSDVFVKLNQGEIRHPESRSGFNIRKNLDSKTAMKLNRMVNKGFSPEEIAKKRSRFEQGYQIQDLFNRSRGKRNFDLNPEQKEKIKNMRKQGLSDNEIADKTGNYLKHVLNVETFSQWLDRRLNENSISKFSYSLNGREVVVSGQYSPASMNYPMSPNEKESFEIHDVVDVDTNERIPTSPKQDMEIKNFAIAQLKGEDYDLMDKIRGFTSQRKWR